MEVINASASSLFGLDEPICPYTGLRTFTEEEAIYFRGRESHVAKCLALLAEQRFLMITGASGDGKSSLVFAGMLPEMRAGFLRARHSSWAVANFRPERSPLRNLAQALATALRLPNSTSVETELEQGFSALVQLYQTSELSPAAAPLEGLAPAERRRDQRQAANLVLVVDQFEEFFTNPENYAGDAPTTAAQTVVNLLLETARLAQAENLPIYIVCTMRSDFVGQCAEFRGLIEQVGASQYFLPRLLRHEFVEVIKEPAVLSGNRISERLVQRLLYDIGQGQDQLPVLQHALRRIWLAADEGREEMDLIHYAMVGGLSDELPAADQARFAAWRAALAAHQQGFLLAKSSLRNVLDAHANQLYFEANNLYNADFAPPLPPGTAERVIEQTFRVLTRTDGKRVVRSRVTGAQLTAILQDEALPWPVVCRILRPFRAAGTTFLSPFLGEDEDDRAVLPPEALLDITHESLIRNWNHLAEWAASEAKDVRLARDFQQQASSWRDNAESRDFLLAFGPYTIMSEWHTNKKGAASWLQYYLEATPGAVPRPEQAPAQNGLLMRYLQTSRRHLWSQLLAARYGAGWLVAAVLLLPVLASLAWGWWTWRQKQSDYVADKLVQSGLKQVSTVALPLKDRSRFILNVDRLKDVVYRPWLGGRAVADNSFPRQLTALHNDTLALDIELDMLAKVDNLDYDSVERQNPYIQPILLDLGRRLARAGGIARPAGPASAALSERQRRMAVFTARTVMALSYYLTCDARQRARVRPDPVLHQAQREQLSKSRQQLLQKLRDYVQQEIRTTTGPAPSPVAFGFCLRVLLGQGTDGPDKLGFLRGLSPFEPASARLFQRLCPPDFDLFAPEDAMSSSRTRARTYTSYSGGYLTMAMAFAALRLPDQVARCLDTLGKHVERSTEVNSGIALVPYLVKYELLDAENTHQLLAKCALVGRRPFPEVYAAAVYGLLSIQPVRAVFDVSGSQSSAYDVRNSRRKARLGGVNQEYLNSDRVSFSLPTRTRDKAWAVLAGATPEIAKQEALFIGGGAHERPTAVPVAYLAVRNELFLNAFLAKMHGVYLAEIKHQRGPAKQSFAQFSRSLAALQRHLGGAQVPKSATEAFVWRVAALRGRKPHQVDAYQWNLGAPETQDESNTTQLISGAEDPIDFLRMPTRPKTRAFANYYTCSFDAFFRYELEHEAAQATPDPAVVQFLDSVAFLEVGAPDRFSDAHPPFSVATVSTRAPQYVANLTWLRAIAHTALPTGDGFRQQRNAALLDIEETLQNRAYLRDSGLTRSHARRLLRWNRLYNSTQQPVYFALPLAMAFSDLATALAHEGRVAEAFALVDSLDAGDNSNAYNTMLSAATKIRVSEQAMLTNNRAALPLLEGFLLEYLTEHQAGVVTVDENKPHFAAASILTVCFWRPLATESDTVSLLAPSLTYQLNNQPLVTGLFAPFKAYGLADKVYQANEEMMNSPFRLQPTLIRDINFILLGYVHFKSTGQARYNGWREYDEAALTTPADYYGFN